jgi:hypothetical protein
LTSFATPLVTVHELVHYFNVANPAVIFCDPGDVMSKVTKALDIILSKASSKPIRPAIIGLGERGAAPLAVCVDICLLSNRKLADNLSFLGTSQRKRINLTLHLSIYLWMTTADIRR